MELLENGTVAVTGVVKRAYPLRSLSSISTDEDSAEQLLDTFSPGVGPCGADATQLVTAVIEHHILSQLLPHVWLITVAAIVLC